MKDSFIFYRSFKDSLSELSADDKLLMYEAISDYALNKTEPNLSGFPKALFSLIRPQLDANWKRFENGSKGGAPKGNKNALKTTDKQPTNNQKQSKTIGKQPNVNVFNVNENVFNENNTPPNPLKGEKSESASKKFIIPTIEEIRQYCEERKNNIDPEYFIDHYTSNGWMVGKSKMKDWKAAVRKWEKPKGGNNEAKEPEGEYLPY